jgi:hypothetical protein
MLAWLVHEQGIEPHIPVIDNAGRGDGTLRRADFVYDRREDAPARAERRPGRIPSGRHRTEPPGGRQARSPPGLRRGPAHRIIRSLRRVASTSSTLSDCSGHPPAPIAALQLPGSGHSSGRPSTVLVVAAMSSGQCRVRHWNRPSRRGRVSSNAPHAARVTDEPWRRCGHTDLGLCLERRPKLKVDLPTCGLKASSLTKRTGRRHWSFHHTLPDRRACSIPPARCAPRTRCAASASRARA